MEWRKIPGFGRYSVREDGAIRRDACKHCGVKERRITPGINDRGYLRAGIVRDDDRNITRTVHSFVALAFIGSRPAGMVVCHRNGKKLHNHYRNLRYGTQKSNIADALAHRTHVMGSRHPHAKLTEAKVRKIHRLWATGKLSQEAIGKLYGVSQRAVWQILHGKRWRHVKNAARAA